MTAVEGLGACVYDELETRGPGALRGFSGVQGFRVAYGSLPFKSRVRAGVNRGLLRPGLFTRRRDTHFAPVS